MPGADHDRIEVRHGPECIDYTGARSREGGRALDSLGTLDAAALGLLLIALVRGLWNGLVREAFSLGALAAACLAVRFGTAPAADALARVAPVEPGSWAATLLAGAGLALAAALAVGLAGRALRGGLRAAGLGPLDRVGGGLLGVAEGALLLAVLLLGARAVLGPGHPWLSHSRAVAWVAEARERVTDAGPDVAAPPPRSPGGGGGR